MKKIIKIIIKLEGSLKEEKSTKETPLVVNIPLTGSPPTYDTKHIIKFKFQ
jgi:hypothetical protein